MKKKCCGNCVYADRGTCGFAGEISTDFLCDHYIEDDRGKNDNIRDKKRDKAT